MYLNIILHHCFAAKPQNTGTFQFNNFEHPRFFFSDFLVIFPMFASLVTLKIHEFSHWILPLRKGCPSQVVVYEVSTGERLRRLGRHKDTPLALGFSPSGEYLAPWRGLGVGEAPTRPTRDVGG